ncbi:MAG: alanine racemase [Clostridia bacterium]|nr:alanine racemase [Clostridia bacterium]
MITQYPVRTIDLSALRENVRTIRAALPDTTMLMAVVKADAYGHGIVQTAGNALAAGADWLAVARTDEGVLLREAGIDAPVLVLGAASGLEIGDGVRHGLTMAVCAPGMVKAVQRWAAKEGKPGLVQLKLDTGMGRIGVRNEAEVRAMLDTLAACPEVRLTGVFTHFADADGDTADYTRAQLERFKRLTALLPAGIIRHCANSASIHRYPDAALDMVRAGISMYGCPPVATDMPLLPVMDWRTAVTFVKEVKPGDKVSYGCTFTADKPMTLATVACGYGDGYHRAGSGRAQVIIHGRRCPVVGRICMDQMMVDVTGVDGVEPGDEAVLMGAQDGTVITADELGAWSGTISYEVLLAATERVHRRWVNGCE